MEGEGNVQIRGNRVEIMETKCQNHLTQVGQDEECIEFDSSKFIQKFNYRQKSFSGVYKLVHKYCLIQTEKLFWYIIEASESYLIH